jgi:CRP/FNR family transcriptional regulator, cyclic AMP receptor protein
VQRTFGGVALLSRLSDRQRERLARLATIRSFAPGAQIVRQGDTSMSFYVVLAGAVRIDHHGESGGTVEVQQLGTGGAFGELGLIEDAPRGATVTATEPTTCALLAKWDFQNELREDPEIALALLPVLTARIRELNALLAGVRSS